MNKLSVQDNRGKTWERVSKATARAKFQQGTPVTFCPVKLHPFGAWSPSVTRAGNEEINFETYLLNFDWYNCTAETGKYSAYYIERVTP